MKSILVLLIKFYQSAISQYLPSSCKSELIITLAKSVLGFSNSVISGRESSFAKLTKKKIPIAGDKTKSQTKRATIILDLRNDDCFDFFSNIYFLDK